MFLIRLIYMLAKKEAYCLLTLLEPVPIIGLSVQVTIKTLQYGIPIFYILYTYYQTENKHFL